MGLTGAARPAGGSATESRHAAALILDLVLERRVPFEQAWAGETARLDRLSARDRSFARLLVTTALRRLGEVDHLLAGLMRSPPPAKASMVRQILRLGVVQLRFLDTPPHAAIDQAVRLTTRSDHASMSGLVNAVLRKVPTLPAIPPERAARLNTPDWLFQRWYAAWGAEAAKAIARAHAAEPPLDLTVKGVPEDWAARLGGTVLPTGGVRLPRAGDVAALAGYGEGAWWVQDAAAALPARLLAPPKGAAVLDLCAAPGGKAAQLAVMGARVTVVEAEPRRAELLRGNLDRLGLDARVVVADAARFRPEPPADFILLDAPCTATGTLRRHPDIAWLKTAVDVARMAEVQRTLLAHAAGSLAPGGRLVYAVCSLQPEEGPERIDALLQQDGTIARDPVRPQELPGLEAAITPAGDVMTLPSMWPELGYLDGFFIARLKKGA